MPAADRITRQVLIRKLTEAHELLRSARREIAELRETNAELRVERDAADQLLGVAMDALTEGRS